MPLKATELGPLPARRVAVEWSVSPSARLFEREWTGLVGHFVTEGWAAASTLPEPYFHASRG
jgi:hypothetical protein